MDKAVIYIAYHPEVLYRYACIRQRYSGKFLSVLVICMHPYVNPDIIKHYSHGFDHVILLPDLKYEANIFRVVFKVIAFVKDLNQNMKPILDLIDGFYIVSNASAFLPVNILLSKLRQDRKFRSSISVVDEIRRKPEVCIFKSAYILFLALIFRLRPSYFHKKLAFQYINCPVDRVLKFNSPFTSFFYDKKTSIPVYNVFETVRKRPVLAKDMVIIYGDWAIFDGDEYGCSLSYEEYKNRLTLFFSSLSKYYENCRLIYKPHPLDKARVMPGLDNVVFELYTGQLISQLHLDINIDRVKACYSVASVSLRYSAVKGIPSYTLYKYLEFKNRYPAAFFEEEEALRNPFLCNISKIEEIGRIDDIEVEPVENSDMEIWDMLMDSVSNEKAV